jgi:hypothetical protein
MNAAAEEPVIVAVTAWSPYPRRAAVADVLLLPSGHRAPSERCAALFRRHPGLTLVVIAAPNPDDLGVVRERSRRMHLATPRSSGCGVLVGVLVGVRDGRLVRLRRPAADPVAAAVLAYGWWAAGIDPRSPLARRAARSAGFALRVGRWRPQAGEPAAHVGGAGGALPVEDPQR